MQVLKQRRVATLSLRVGLAIGVALGLGVAACAGSTTMEQTWKSPTLVPNNLHNVVVVYISSDGTMRRTAEDSMVQKLAGEGVRATPAYAILSNEELKDHNLTKAKLLAGGYDGVLALRLVSADTQVAVMPAATWGGFWGPAWGGAYDAAYLSTETVVRVETSVYQLSDGKLVWTGLSKTVDPRSMGSAIGDVTHVVAKTLEKQQVVAPAG